MSIAFSGEKTTFGNKAVAIGTITLTDQASGAVQVLGYIDNAMVSKNAMVDGEQTYTVYTNQASGATSIDGYLRLASATSGDVFTVFAWGRP